MKGDWLLKFSKKKYIDEMHKHGRFRVSPASYYSKGSHLKAVKDFEMERIYKFKALTESMAGEISIEWGGADMPIKNGFIEIHFTMDDYFIFCTCKEISRRMPTDFDSDAVLIIKDKKEFLARMKSHMIDAQPDDWEFAEGDVYYYDPYNDVPRDPKQEFYKHISYRYQREHRCILRRKYKDNTGKKLAPFFVELGDLSDISEVLSV